MISAARKTSETDANGKTTTYVYDSLDRLTSITRTLVRAGGDHQLPVRCGQQPDAAHRSEYA